MATVKELIEKGTLEVKVIGRDTAIIYVPVYDQNTAERLDDTVSQLTITQLETDWDLKKKKVEEAVAIAKDAEDMLEFIRAALEKEHELRAKPQPATEKE